MRKTPYYRVSGCVNPAGHTTSVCFKLADMPALERLAYGDRSTVNSTIRAASQDVALLSNRSAEGSALNSKSWSQAVVSRARAQLAGNFQPAKAAALEALTIAELERDIDAAVIAAENNLSWSADAVTGV